MIDIKANFNENSIEGVVCGTPIEITGETIFVIQHICESIAKYDSEMSKLYINGLRKFIEKEAAK